MRVVGPQSEAAWYKPNWRELQARDYSLIPSDMYVERYRYFLKNQDTCEDDPVVAAHIVSVKPWLRGQVESYFMAGLSPHEITERFHLYEETVEMYQKLFCDLEPIQDKRGSLLEACLDEGAGPDLSRLRLFGLRYGPIFLDWILSKITILEEKDFEQIELRLRSILLMRAVEVDMVKLSDKERFDTVMKVISTLSRYKASLARESSGEDLQEVIEQLRGLVTAADPPKGLPKKVFETQLARPKRGAGSELTGNGKLEPRSN